MTSEELWDECVEVFENHCGDCLYSLSPENYEEERSSLLETIKYWGTTDTRGGTVLWESGAYVHLSDKALNILEEGGQI